MRKTGRLQRRLLQGSFGWRWGSFVAGVGVTHPRFAGRSCTCSCHLRKPRSGRRAARGCSSTCLFLESERIWSWRLGKRRRSRRQQRRSSYLWPGWSGTAVLGRTRARCSQQDTASLCYSGVGERWPEARQGLYRRLAFAAALAPAAVGGRRRVGLAGRAAVLLSLLRAGRHCGAGSPAPSWTEGKREVAQLEVCF